MSKKDVVLSLLESGIASQYIPAGFFIHFDPKFHRGQAAVNKHLEFFHFTGMDFLKIQYENRFPTRSEINKPADWIEMPCYGLDFYEDQVNIARGLVEAAGKDALVLMTLYSPFMCAGHSVGKDVLSNHLLENSDQTKKGIEIITDSLLTFVEACISVGVDGFYHSTQGGEIQRFGGSPIFDECVKPYDLVLMNQIEEACEFNILHICDYEGDYKDLSTYLDYPGHVVNASLKLGDQTISCKELSKKFSRPIMGGLDRHGIIATGNQKEIVDAVNSVCHQAPQNFILGADCTLPSDIDWQNIKTAIDTSHHFER